MFFAMALGGIAPGAASLLRKRRARTVALVGLAGNGVWLVLAVLRTTV